MITVDLVKETLLQTAAISNPRSPISSFQNIDIERTPGRILFRAQSSAIIMENSIDVPGDESWMVSANADKARRLIQSLPGDYQICHRKDRLIAGNETNSYELCHQEDPAKRVYKYELPENMIDLPFDLYSGLKNAKPYILKSAEIKPVLNTITLFPQEEGLFAVATDGFVLYEKQLYHEPVLTHPISIDSNIIFSPDTEYSISTVNNFNKFFIKSQNQVIIHNTLTTPFPSYRQFMRFHKTTPPIIFDYLEMESALQRLMIYANYNLSKSCLIECVEGGLRLTTADSLSKESGEEFIHAEGQEKDKKMRVNIPYFLQALKTLRNDLQLYLSEAVYMSNKHEIITIMPMGE